MTILLSISTANAQLSPGDLHAVHADLEGLANCTRCHEIGTRDFGKKCLSCHDLLADRIQAGNGLHARPGYDRCESCHIDHQGRDFALVHWENGQSNFDHGLTGFELLGNHRDLKCEQCHQPKNIENKQVLLEKKKSLTRTLLGLDLSCLGCHEDTHGGDMDRDCLGCHEMNGWRPAPGFDHDTTRFKLLGKHRETDCAECHKPLQTGENPRFSPLAFASCLDCHQDEHQDQLTDDCLGCHEMSGWKPAPRFDHRETAFQLTGAHSRTECGSCHPREETGPRNMFTRFQGIAFQNCRDCHTDPHENRLGSSCEQCHNTKSWQSYRKSAFNHDMTRYSLEGKHRETRCEDCHRGGPERKELKFETCSDCHADVHRGQLDRRIQQDGCEACHTVMGFSPARFGLQDHQDTAFPLEDSHRAVPCFSCHLRPGSDLPDGVWQFAFEKNSCTPCHADPHRGTTAFARSWDEKNDMDGCTVCHDQQQWSRIHFPHDRTEFALTGAHREAGCLPCHGSPDHTNLALQLEGTSQQCASCHEDPHQAQFRETVSAETSCGRCHLTETWKPTNFDHNQTRFSLEGAHENASCESCHPHETNGDIAFIRYRPLDHRCEACHGH